MAKNKSKIGVGGIFCYAGLIFYALLLILPIYTVIATSFTPTDDLTSSVNFIWLPDFTLDAYKRVFDGDIYSVITGIPSMVLGFLNTMWITLVPTTVGLLMSGLSAYSFSKMKFKGKEFLFGLEIIIMVFPLGAFSVVSQIFYYELGWMQTPLPLVIPGLFGSIGTMFFLRMYMDGISDSVIEAAKIDGLGYWGIFFKIVMPLARPAFIAQFIFAFVSGYNNYMGSLIYLDGNYKWMTLSLVLGNIKNIFTGEGMENVHCAAAVLGMLPLIIIYVFLSKIFIEGVAMGGDKE